MTERLEDAIADLERIAELIDFRNGIGDAMLDIALEQLRESFDSEKAPDGTPWDALAPEYEAAKSRQYPGAPIGVRTADMRSGLDGGERSIEPTVAEWTFGDTEHQRDKAEWFSKRRKFIALNQAILDEVDATIQRTFRENL